MVPPKKRNEKIYLTIKERTCLKLLLKNGRMSNSCIARHLKISRQAVGRMRRKLESLGIIKKYTVHLDYDYMGISVFAIILFDIENSHETKLDSPNLINLHRVLTNSATHIALYAFSDLDSFHDYLSKIESDHSHHVKIVGTHVFPNKGLLKNSTKNLFHDILKNFNKNGQYFPKNIPHHVRKEIKRKPRKLNTNEKEVLQHFIKDPRITCKKISDQFEKNKITANGVNHIKLRLERKKIIRRFSVKLDYKKLGINAFAFIFLSKKPNYWQHLDSLGKWARSSDNVIGCFRVSENSMHVLYCGFKNLEELDKYCHILENKNRDFFKVKHIYISSSERIIKESTADLFLSLLT